jgi:hypothetical protein
MSSPITSRSADVTDRDTPEAAHLPSICCREHAIQAATIDGWTLVPKNFHSFRNLNPEAECPICHFPAWSHDPAMAVLMNSPIVAPAPSEPKEDWALVPEDWDPHALDDQHPCLVCGGVTSHDHSVAEWKAALQALAPNKWAHTAKNDPAGLYDDNWEPKTSRSKEDQS